MFGSFFGCSAPILVALDMPKSDIRRLIRLVQNMDRNRIAKLRSELEFFSHSLNKLKFTYGDPELRRSVRKVSLIREGHLETMTSFGIAKESSSDDLEKVAQELEEKLEIEAKSKGIEKDVSRSFLSFDGKRVVVGDEGADLLLHFYNTFRNDIASYIQLCEVLKYSRRVVFGEELHNVVRVSPVRLLTNVRELIDRNPAIVPKVREDIEFLRSKISTTPLDAKSITADTLRKERDRGLRLFDFMRAYREVDENSAEMVQLLEIFSRDSENFAQALDYPISIGAMTRAEVEVLTDMYVKLFCLDNDPVYICRTFFPNTRALSLEEIDQIFKQLNDIQFLYFSRVSSKLLVESLKELSFSSEEREVIYSDPGPRGLLSVLSDIENYCRSLKAGAILEEIL